MPDLAKAREAALNAMRGLNMLTGPTPGDLDAAIDVYEAKLAETHVVVERVATEAMMLASRTYVATAPRQPAGAEHE